MAIFGYNSKKLVTETLPNITCKHCGSHEGFRATLFSKYAHISFIPAFPLGRPAFMECVHCKRTLGEKEFSAEQATALASLKATHKSPIWTWSFLILTGLFMVSTTLYEALRTKSKEEKLLHADFDLMATKKVQENDSLGQLLSTYMKLVLTEEVKPSGFHYLTKHNGNQLLVLVEIPELRNSTETAQKQALEVVTEFLEKTEPDVATLYVGIHADEVIKATKTPSGIKAGSSASESDLYPFYATPHLDTTGSNATEKAKYVEKSGQGKKH